MLLIETLVAIILICGMSAGAAFVVTRILRLLDARTLDGKIEKKRAELAEQDRYIRRQRTVIAKGHDAAKDEIVAQYVDLAEKKREQTHTQLEALLLEKERRDFEDHMKGNK